MSTPEERLQRSMAEFYAMLDSMHFTGVSQVMEVQQLKILIERYPDQARFYLDNHGRQPRTDSCSTQANKHSAR